MPIRLAALAAYCLMAASCGRSPPASQLPATTATVAAPSLSPPRTIEIPLNARPLAPADAIELTVLADEAIAAQLTQASSASPLPRIRDLAATPDPASRALIREPGAKQPEVQEPRPQIAAAPPRQNTFVPISLPVVTPPAASTVTPQLADRPTFDLPENPPSAPPALAQNRWLPVSLPSPSAPQGGGPALPAEQVAPRNQTFAAPPAPASSPSLAAVTGQAAEISDRAVVMMQRGLHYSARAELLKSLQLVSQSLDAQHNTQLHTAALAAAQAALQEAQDAPTPTAQLHSLAGAQSQLTIAAGNSPVASQTLSRLGRVHSSLATSNTAEESVHLPQAIAFHQAALATDGTNHLAANELGVLLAQAGQLPAARQALLHSLSLRPQVESWHNLAVVHRRLGESDLARRAEHERDLAVKSTRGRSANRPADAVRWVDAPALAAKNAGSRAGDIPWRENAQSELAASPAGQRR